MAKMNLLPEGYLRQRLQYRVDMLCVLLFGIVMVSIMTAETISSRQIEETRVTHERVVERYSVAAEQVQDFFALRAEKLKLMKEAEVISAIAERIPRSLLLAMVTNMCPKDMTLTNINVTDTIIVQQVDPEEQKRRKRMTEEEREKEKAKQPPPPTQLNMAISGLSANYNEITQFLQKLKNSPIMADVDVDFTRERRLQDRMLLEFRIQCVLLPTAEITTMLGSQDGEPIVPGVDNLQRNPMDNASLGLLGRRFDSPVPNAATQQQPSEEVRP